MRAPVADDTIEHVHYARLGQEMHLFGWLVVAASVGLGTGRDGFDIRVSFCLLVCLLADNGWMDGVRLVVRSVGQSVVPSFPRSLDHRSWTVR